MKNSLKYAKILEESGFSRKMAETSIQVFSDISGADMATKTDILEVKQEIKDVRKDLTQEINAVRHEISLINQKIDFEIRSLESRMVLKLGVLMAAFLTTGLTAAKLMFLS